MVHLSLVLPFIQLILFLSSSITFGVLSVFNAVDAVIMLDDEMKWKGKAFSLLLLLLHFEIPNESSRIGQ